MVSNWWWLRSRWYSSCSELVKLSHPAQGVFLQQSPGDFIVTISKGQSRTSGVLLLLLGAGILGAVFYRRRS